MIDNIDNKTDICYYKKPSMGYVICRLAAYTQLECHILSYCYLRLAKQEVIIYHQFSNTKATISHGAVKTAIVTPTTNELFTSV